MSYFDNPSERQNPVLFDEQGNFRPEIREELLNRLKSFWSVRYQGDSWYRVWIAGSSLTSQWDKSPNRGDLDILIGVNVDDFRRQNPSFTGYSEKSLAGTLNAELRTELWPRMENWHNHEVTFYVNHGGWDILNLRPYAAYSLTANEWTVRPPELPENWGYEWFPEAWRTTVEREAALVDALAHDIEQEERRLVTTQAFRRPVLQQRLDAMRTQMEQWWTSIHGGRRQAFQSVPLEGGGFFDYYNFRWQAHKLFGTVDRIRSNRNRKFEV